MGMAKRSHGIERLAIRFVWLIVVSCVAVLVIGRFGYDCDACDTLNIGYPYWLVEAVSGIVMLAMIRARRGGRWWPIAAITVLAIGAAFRMPMPVATACVAGAPTNRLKIVSFNAWVENSQSALAARWILDQRPDVVVLLEAKGRAAPLPALLAPALPHQVACLANIPCSTKILSRFPPTVQMPLGQGDVENRKGLSAAALSLAMPNGRSVTVVGVHLSRPLPLGQQRRELTMLEDRLASYDPASLIIAGDFNATPDSLTLRRFAANNEIGRASMGGSWPTALAYPRTPGLLAIDHVFLGRAIGLVDRGVGPEIGSDHLPIVATVCLPERR